MYVIKKMRARKVKVLALNAQQIIIGIIGAQKFQVIVMILINRRGILQGIEKEIKG